VGLEEHPGSFWLDTIPPLVRDLAIKVKPIPFSEVLEDLILALAGKPLLV